MVTLNRTLVPLTNINSFENEIRHLAQDCDEVATPADLGESTRTIPGWVARTTLTDAIQRVTS